MQTLDKLRRIIESVHSERQFLRLDETLEVLLLIQQISKEPQLIEKVIHLVKKSQEKTALINKLSKREYEVFRWIGLGSSSREIGELMNITEATVSTHRKNIIKKLGINGPGQLQKLALRSMPMGRYQ
ncbi:MAG: LuxR C-terminal-related transcriptional regulator [Flavobacteriaceae bacterium]|nr:LuxR C-terminal-related transcriptional regulator [Flavobacteriaceae bacterium]